MRSSWVAVGLVVTLALLPRCASGQCMGGTSVGRHDHAVATGATGGVSGEKQLRQAIERLLAEERGRTMLMEALLADAPFMREMIRRIAANPEWKALAAEGLAAPPAKPPPVRSDSAAAGGASRTPRTDAVLYRCPMHRDITSARPGSCSKCGMALRREAQ